MLTYMDLAVSAAIGAQMWAWWQLYQVWVLRRELAREGVAWTPARLDWTVVGGAIFWIAVVLLIEASQDSDPGAIHDREIDEWFERQDQQERDSQDRWADEGGDLNPYSTQGGWDLDCSDFDGPVAVGSGDPHGLDRDGDGIGCE